MELQSIRLKNEAKGEAFREPAELGHCGHRDGQSRAEFKVRDSGRELRFKGPYHDREELAQDDLLTIRAAATKRMTRAEALQAMELQAIHLKNEATGEDGGLHAKGSQHQARVQYTDSSGARKDMYGPVRHDARRAQADLETIRAAAASKPARPECFEAMADEAHRLQKHAAFEAEVAIAVGKEQRDRKHMLTDSESEPEQGNIDYAIHDEPFPSYDVSTPEARERLVTAPRPRKKPREEKPPANSLEATTRLAQFRPVIARPADLRALLEARAEPNVCIGAGSVTPLQNVLTFAQACDVAEMRLLLLEYGASQSMEDRDHWKTRAGYDKYEPTWLTNFHRDDRAG
jgi:hypothetical protein